MKRIYLYIAFVATVCLVCSCGEEKPMITLYEVENGDTIEVKHEITASEIQEWLIDGYQFKEEDPLVLRYPNREEAPSVLELYAFLSYYDVMKIEENKIKDLKELVQTIHRPIEAQVFIYNDDNHIGIYSTHDNPSQLSYGICAKRDGFNKYCEKLKENDEYSDYNETELQYVTMMAFILSKSIPCYFTARSFESKSGVITRVLTACEPK